MASRHHAARRLPWLFAALVVALAGCFEIDDTWTLNPDRSGKLTRRITIPSMGRSAEQWSADFVKKAKGIEAWSDLATRTLPDGRLEITATGKPRANEAPIRHSSKIRIQGKLFGEILAEPEAFRFGVKPGESFSRTVKLRRTTGQPFTVISATLESRQLPDAELVVVPISPSEYELIVTSQGRTQLGQIGGRVVVRTDVPGEEEFVMSFIGVVRTSPGGVR